MLLAVTAGATGCGSSYATMRSEEFIAPFGQLSRRARDMPRQTARVRTIRSGEPAVDVAVHKTGSPAADGPVLVLIHGLFSDASAWRYVVGDLGENHTIWMVDLPGCGASDKPSPSELSADGYGPTALAERIYQALGAAMATEPDDRRVVLVGHSYGATIALRMLADPALRERHADPLSRVDGLVLVTPLDVAIEKSIPSLEYLAHVSPWDVWLAASTGVLRERAARAVRESYREPRFAPREEVDRSIRMLVAQPTRRAMQAMILQSTPRRAGPRPDWDEVDRLVGQYSNVDVPVRVTCGANDETLPASMSYKLAAQLPFAALEVIPDCMHSPHLERPRECAAVIDQFVTNRKNWSAARAGRCHDCPCQSRRGIADTSDEGAVP